MNKRAENINIIQTILFFCSVCPFSFFALPVFFRSGVVHPVRPAHEKSNQNTDTFPPEKAKNAAPRVKSSVKIPSFSAAVA